MSNTKTWAVITEAFGKIHVVPLYDDFDHVTHAHAKGDFFNTGVCWCKPVVEDSNLFFHNAHDGREKYERDQYTPEDIAEYGDPESNP